MRYIAMMELREGGVRGNHYHETKRELVYVISGRVELVVEDRSTRKRESLILQPGDLASIEPGTAHALKVLVSGCGIEFSPQTFDPLDSFPYALA
jgi:quercetin dioxygenase-like cupin family protein